MADFFDAVLGASESSAGYNITGHCDFLISGLTSGTVKLQFKHPASTNNATPAWTDFPDGAYTEDTYKTIFVSEHGVRFRFTGVSNNADVYVRFGRWNND